MRNAKDARPFPVYPATPVAQIRRVPRIAALAALALAAALPGRAAEELPPRFNKVEIKPTTSSIYVATVTMTMPPFTENAEDSRRYFSALRDLAGEHGLRHLSMGTSQDYLVAVQEGATIVRLGTTLYTSSP